LPVPMCKSLIISARPPEAAKSSVRSGSNWRLAMLLKKLVCFICCYNTGKRE